MSIRNAVPTDVPAMLGIYAYFVRETAVSFEYEVPTQEEFARRLAEHMVQFPWLVWEENGEVLGYAYAGRPFERAAYHWCAEISCYLAAQVRGRGVGRKLYARIEELLRKQGYREVSMPSSPPPTSRRWPSTRRWGIVPLRSSRQWGIKRAHGTA